MKILIAEDDPVSRHLLQNLLTRWGYEVIATENGEEAWFALQDENAPRLAILDWMMPGMDGIEVCRQARQVLDHPLHIILLTIKVSKKDIVEGLEAGADDYITKPFDNEELRARVSVGARIVGLQSELADRLQELEETLAQVKQLEGLLPMCAYCKRVRDDLDYWQQVEVYIEAHSEARFSHGICPECYEKHLKPQMEARKRQREKENKNG